MKSNEYIKGVIYCFIATVSWGVMFPVMTSALRLMDPFTFTAIRYTIAGLVFSALLLVREGKKGFSLKGARWGLTWLFGSAGFAGFGFLVFLGQKLAGPEGALTASIMMSTMPMLGLIVVWALKKSRPPLFSLAFILMSFLGVVLVITKGEIQAVLNMPSNYAANIPLIFGALCWVVYTVGASYFPDWSPYKYTAITTILGLTTIYSIDALLMAAHVIPIINFKAAIAVTPHLIYMALVAGFVGVLCWNLGNKIITPLNGVLFMDVVPVTAFLISTLTGVVPERIQVIGACITATALLLNNFFQRLAIKKSSSVSKASVMIISK